MWGHIYTVGHTLWKHYITSPFPPLHARATCYEKGRAQRAPVTRHHSSNDQRLVTNQCARGEQLRDDFCVPALMR